MIKHIHYDKKVILDSLKRAYNMEYPFLNILNITVKPTNYSDIRDFKIDKIDIRKNILKKNKNTFSVYFKRENKTKRIFFKYKVNATLNILVATKNILKDEIISTRNTKIKMIAFRSLYTLPMSIKDLGKVSSKKYITKNSTISSTLIQIIPDIRRRDLVVAKYLDGMLSVELEVVALDTGFIGQMIRVKDKKKKIYKVKIIDKGVVRIR
jgi:flagella basal body P-ring formation protein FlgA